LEDAGADAGLRRRIRIRRVGNRADARDMVRKIAEMG
jgi:hypothetical protein